MNKSFSSLLALLCLPLLALAQLVTVPKNVYFADIHLRISDGAQEEIQKKVDALHRNQTYFKMKVDLADAYFPVIERVFKEEGVPDDFKYLALQESGLLGDAVSTSNAVGYWQFKREAAQDFNLRMDNKIDERRHIVEASRGAAKYFLRSNKYYNNWFNSLLSYYLGYSGAKPYTSPSDNGARKMDVTEKSHPYVVTFLAHKIAYDAFVGKANPPALSLREMRGTPGQSLADIAMATQTDYAELEKYNKWLLGSSIPSDKDYYVMIPVRNGGSDAGLLASKDTATPSSTRKGLAARISKRNGLSTITAQPGDTKEKLARKAGLSTQKFLKYNDMHNFDDVVVGSAYYTEKKNMTADAEYHVVQPGETMQLISQHYGVRLNYLLFKNRMNRREVPVPGRVLWLQNRRPASTPVEVRDLNKVQAKTAATVSGQGLPQTAPSRQDDPKQEKENASQAEPASEGNIFKRFINSFKRFKKPEPEQEEEEQEVVVAEKVVVTEKAVIEKKKQAPAPAVSSKAPAAEKAKPAEDGWLEAQEEEWIQTEEKKKEVKTAEAAPVNPLPATEPQQKKIVLYPQKDTMKPVKDTARQAPVNTLPAQEETIPTTVEAQPSTSPVPVEESQEEETAEEWNIGAPTEDEKESEAKSIFVEPAATKPAAKPATTVKKQETAPAAAPQPAPKPARHVVRQGETLYGISRMYAVTVNDLTAWNKLGDAPIRVGQELLIAEPLVRPELETPEETPVTMLSTASDYHTVVAGETLYQISKQYNVSLADIRNWNNLTDNNIRLGQELRVKAPAGGVAPAKVTETSSETSSVPSTGYHTVAGGESMYQISRKYGVTIKDIMEWNNKSDFAVSVGEKLLIKKK